MSNLDNSHIISAAQHDIVKGISCLTNLRSTPELVSSWVDEGKSMDISYMDVSKAFDSV